MVRSRSELPSVDSVPRKGVGVNLGFLVRWMNWLGCKLPEWNEVGAETIFQDLKNGVALCRVVAQLVPQVDLSRGFYPRAHARRTSLSNIELALSVAWQKGVRSANMCNAEDIYEGRAPRVLRCLAEFFEVLQMRDVRRRFRDDVQEMHSLLAPLGRPLSATHKLRGDGLVADFADGTRQMSILVLRGKANVKDMACLWGRPGTTEQWTENGELLNKALGSAGLPTLLLAQEWASPPPPSPDTLVLQLHLVWRLSEGRCASPPALAGFTFKDGSSLRLPVEALGAGMHSVNVGRATLPEPSIRLLVDFPSKRGAWPLPTPTAVVSVASSGVTGRFPGTAEERAWLYGEDRRRREELSSCGLDPSVIHRAASVAVEEVPDFSPHRASLEGEVEFPTTSIDAQVSLGDGSKIRVWIQTAVVDREDGGSAAFVVEIRQRCGHSGVFGPLCAQLDVSQVVAVEQTSPGDPSLGDFTYVSFIVISNSCGSLLGGQGSLQQDLPVDLQMFHPRDGSLLLCVLAGPSAWKRQEAVRFFDELRILRHFLAEGGLAKSP